MAAASLRTAFPSPSPGATTHPDPVMDDVYHDVVEVADQGPSSVQYLAYLPNGRRGSEGPTLLQTGESRFAPFLTFRWLKAAGELYGRSPVMTALPDIKTVNKVVELILRNAAIAATGIWLAEDDGILNPANIRLVPGSIISKAPGSAGLVPLQAPGRFDVSQLLLDDLRSRIRHTLLSDRLGPVADARLTATEVVERSNETARLLGAAYGRLQAELLTPLVQRSVAILARRGEITSFEIDGLSVDIEYMSPLARAQARDDIKNTLLWLDAAAKLGPEAMSVADYRAAALWLARTLRVPNELIKGDGFIS